MELYGRNKTPDGGLSMWKIQETVDRLLESGRSSFLELK